jgi:chemotaxis signal transduction protein
VTPFINLRGELLPLIILRKRFREQEIVILLGELQ